MVLPCELLAKLPVDDWRLIESTDVGERAAQAGRIGESIDGEHRHGGSREERKPQVLTLYIGRHPLRVFCPAESVVMEEPLPRRYVQPVKIAAAARVAVRIKSRAHFRRLETANLGDCKREEVDGDFYIRYGDVTGDGPRR